MQVAARTTRASTRDLGGGPLQDIGIYCINAARAIFAAEPESRCGRPPRRAATARSSPRCRRPSPRCCASRATASPRSRAASTRRTAPCTRSSAPRAASRWSPPTTTPRAWPIRCGSASARARRSSRRATSSRPSCSYFSDCVLRGREPEPSGEEGLADVRVIEALERSIETGKRGRARRAAAGRCAGPSLDQETPPAAGSRSRRVVHARAPH